jgi:hypothetical protein
MLLQYDLLDWSRLEKRAMHRRVDRLARRYRGRCVAMAKVANEFRCSYQKVRRAVYEMDRKKSFLAAMIGILIASVIMMLLSFGLLKGIIG